MAIDFGVERVVVIGFGALLGIGLLNLFLFVLGRPGFGVWVQAWAKQYVVIAALLAFFVGALIGHFYWATPPNCPSQTSQSAAGAAYPHCAAVKTEPSHK